MPDLEYHTFLPSTLHPPQAAKIPTIKPSQMAALEAVVDGYDAVLLDAYGVLVNDVGALAQSQDFLRCLQKKKIPYLLVTNDASRLPERIAQRMQQLDLQIQEEQIISSGMALQYYFEKYMLKDSRCGVMGGLDAQTYVERAGGNVIWSTASCNSEDLLSQAAVDIFVIGDSIGLQHLGPLQIITTYLVKLYQTNRIPKLILCNPDKIYPTNQNSYGFTSGSFAISIEQALGAIFPHMPEALRTFIRLGKPHSSIFDLAKNRKLGNKLLMVGDQHGTDILGGYDAGMDTALMATGLTYFDYAPQTLPALQPAPTYLCPTLMVRGKKYDL